MRRVQAFLLLLFALTMGPRGAAAFTDCAAPPDPASLEEMALMLQNSQHHARRASAVRAMGPALLALSDGGLRIAFAAGLLAGWSETGFRPDFTVVTAVGKSSLLAPFVFAGASADRELAELIACSDATDWRALARDAASRLTPRLMEKIAARYRQGARLLLVLPGSAARHESVWDMSAIAAGRGTEAHEVFAEILRAAADSEYTPRASGGKQVERDMVFRQLGAGEAFAWPLEGVARYTSITLVHSGVLFPDESDEFIATRGRYTPARHWLMPAAAFEAASRMAGTRFHFASIKPKLNLEQSGTPFDLTYVRALYIHAFRHGRMNSAWRPTLPTLSHP